MWSRVLLFWTTVFRLFVQVQGLSPDNVNAFVSHLQKKTESFSIFVALSTVIGRHSRATPIDCAELGLNGNKASVCVLINSGACAHHSQLHIVYDEARRRQRGRNSMEKWYENVIIPFSWSWIGFRIASEWQSCLGFMKMLPIQFPSDGWMKQLNIVNFLNIFLPFWSFVGRWVRFSRCSCASSMWFCWKTREFQSVSNQFWWNRLLTVALVRGSF